jgi:CheY-like chemotaxis protein
MQGASRRPEPSLLLLNDDVVLRGALAQLLERAGFIVGQASTGEQAIETLRSVWFDLVHVDLHSPGETVDMIRQELPYVRIVQQSGTTEGTLRNIATLLWTGQATEHLCRMDTLATALHLVEHPA